MIFFATTIVIYEFRIKNLENNQIKRQIVIPITSNNKDVYIGKNDYITAQSHAERLAQRDENVISFSSSKERGYMAEYISWASSREVAKNMCESAIRTKKIEDSGSAQGKNGKWFYVVRYRQ